jgi:uncharacterized membrane-anchored protein YhcB (DUF1043 family)
MESIHSGGVSAVAAGHVFHAGKWWAKNPDGSVWFWDHAGNRWQSYQPGAGPPPPPELASPDAPSASPPPSVSGPGRTGTPAPPGPGTSGSGVGINRLLKSPVSWAIVAFIFGLLIGVGAGATGSDPEMQSRLAGLQTDLIDSRGELEDSQSELSEAQATVDALEAQNRELTDQAAKVEAAQGLKQRLAKAQVRLQRLESQLSSARNQLANAKSELAQAGDGEGNCTPGYSPCLAPASDYDCAGGTGDGPKYAQGPIQVTGSDPYDLDSDNDGVACES